MRSFCEMKKNGVISISLPSMQWHWNSRVPLVVEQVAPLRQGSSLQASKMSWHRDPI